MAAVAAAGPRYAPEDPSLPKPWRGLIDGNTGYLYFWNTETNTTQYERPAVKQSSGPPAVPPQKSSSMAVTSSVQLQQSSGYGSKHDTEKDNGRSLSSSNQQFVQQHQGWKNGATQTHNHTNSLVNDGNGASYAYNHIPTSHNLGLSAKGHAASDYKGNLSPEAYRRQHEITVSGDGAPSPFMTFESTGFPAEILREVRYLLQGGANVVRCGAFCPYFGGFPIAGDHPVTSYDGVHFWVKDSPGPFFVTRVHVVLPSSFPWFKQKGLSPAPTCRLIASASGRRILGDLPLLVHQAGFSAPTPIQAQSWPIALKSRDIVAVAKTGSGKTLGYLLPAYLHLNRVRNNSRMGPTVLVLSPTRELATQILDEAIKFGKSSRISCTCLYGGAPKGPQLRDLDRGVDVVVATPGRLNDILEMRRVNLSQVSYLVLDEADRMLDMGFEPQIRKIVKEIPPKRQTLMFTATWPKEVRKIASDLLVNPVQVNIGNIDELVANKSITQYVEVVMPMEKQRRVEQILRSQEPGSKVIIFCSTKRMCDQLARNLTRHFGAAAIHGDKSQSDRDFVLGQFRTGRSPVLVATDVAARGLDIKDIRVVINYDFPTGIEDYVHRIGRTGRAGATGLAYTFFSDQDSKHASDLVKVLEGASQKVPPEIRGMCSRGGYGKIRRWGPGSDYDGRNAGWSNGGGRGDSSFGGRGGHGPYSGRSESSFGGQSDRDRFESKSYHDPYTNDTRGRRDSKSVWGNPDGGYGEKNFRRSRSRSSSPKHNAARNGVQSRRSGSRDRGYSPGRSNGRSFSPHKSASGAYDTAVRCSSPNATNKSYGNRWQTPSNPAKELPDGGHNNNNPVSFSVRSSNVEEEEGMIPAYEDGALPSHGGWGAAIDVIDP